MSCMYGFYKPTEHNRPRLYCKITNDMCVYSKLCTKPSVDRYIFNDKVDECMIKNEKERYDIPEGAYYVRFVRNGYAYVEFSDRVVKVKCNDEVKNYLYVKQNSDGTYEGSISPFTEKTKRRKKSSNEKND